jgi:hypothetical protein
MPLRRIKVSENPKLPPVEEYFCWRELVADEESGETRLLIPWSDPHLYEHPFDYLFATEEQALEAKNEAASEENWILCKERTTPLKFVKGNDDANL